MFGDFLACLTLMSHLEIFVVKLVTTSEICPTFWSVSQKRHNKEVATLHCIALQFKRVAERWEVGSISHKIILGPYIEAALEYTNP